jgi:hypothetical protein
VWYDIAFAGFPDKRYRSTVGYEESTLRHFVPGRRRA